MSRRLVATDRLMTLLVGVALVALGLLVLDWRLGAVLSLPASLDLAPVRSVTSSPAWPWVSAGVGVILVLLGLRWLLAHLPTPTDSDLRLRDSGVEGRLRADLASAVAAAADDYAGAAPVGSTSGAVRPAGRGRHLQLTATVLPEADVPALVDPARDAAADVERALGGDPVTLRVLLHRPARRPRWARPRAGAATSRPRVE